MRIFTSYFGKLRKLPKGYVPVAICGKMMFPYSGLRYTKLAPKIGFFTEWKKTGDNDYYIKHFNDEVLSSLDRETVRREISELVGKDAEAAVLMCYETPEKFCHRHLVARWLGDDVTELSV